MYLFIYFTFYLSVSFWFVDVIVALIYCYIFVKSKRWCALNGFRSSRGATLYCVIDENNVDRYVRNNSHPNCAKKNPKVVQISRDFSKKNVRNRILSHPVP